jgi:RNA polymerase sigma-70 factor (ECF subfamily)
VEGRPLDEDELITRAKGGDETAYEDLVRAHQHVAFRTAFLITGTAADAEDAAQAAFIKAWLALRRFRGGEPFRPWICRIAANEARNRRKAARRREGLSLRLAQDRPRDDAAPSPEAAVLSHEQGESLLRAVNGLRERDRLLIGYRFFLGFSEKETADVLGVAPGTVKSRLSRTLGRLRERLGPLGEELTEARHE